MDLALYPQDPVLLDATPGGAKMTLAPIQGKCPVCHQDSANTAFQAGAASRDAEIAQLNKEAAEKFSALAKEYDQLRAELEYDQRNAAMSQSESARLLDENTKLRAELVKALAIQPDDSALKAWLGAPVAWEFTDAFGTHYTDDQRDWMDTPGIESVTCLYSPKGLK